MPSSRSGKSWSGWPEGSWGCGNQPASSIGKPKSPFRATTAIDRLVHAPGWQQIKDGEAADEIERLREAVAAQGAEIDRGWRNRI